MAEGSGESTKVVVDLHEPFSIRQLALAHPDVDGWREEVLDAADIVVNGVGVERKRPSDFASSMLEDRLDEQIRKLKDAYDDAAILIEGGFDDFDDLDHTRLNPQSARGKAASTHMRHGIPVVPTGGDPGSEEAERLLVDYAVRLGRKATETPSSDYLESSVVGSDEPLGKRLWGCFDGVGPGRAGMLYEEYHGPIMLVRQSSNAVEAGGLPPGEFLRSKLEEVSGIGDKTADSLVEQMLGQEGADHVEIAEASENASQQAQSGTQGVDDG